MNAFFDKKAGFPRNAGSSFFAGSTCQNVGQPREAENVQRTGQTGRPRRASAAATGLSGSLAHAAVWALLAVACGSNPEVVNRGELAGATGGVGYEANKTPGTLDFDAGVGGGGGTAGNTSVCGNGKLESKELCDDGNTQDGDGCSPDCTVQDLHFRCKVPGQPCEKWVTCGNGLLEGDESCDDGNTTSGDGCSAACDAVEAGWGCARPGKPCVELPVCGNGRRERGEGCDDGQAAPVSGDGCSADCQQEPGFWCQTPGQSCIPEKCGDGTRTPDEECDDHNSDTGDGCSNLCKVEANWRCSSLGCSPVCGDGVPMGRELCDDGNLTTGDGCSASCLVEPYYSCSGVPSKCVSSTNCGNSVREAGEICDPPGVSGCLPGCKSFSPDIGPATKCGNSIIEAGEACDPPMPGKGCTTGCTVEPGWSCARPGVCFALPVCGDGVVNGTDACDDGNAKSGDGCFNCAVEANWSCYGLGPSRCLPEVCGDGILTPSEQCDDKNPTAGDGCTSCKLDAGWVCPVQGKSCRPRCGDGVKIGGEACDDGNVVNRDGCNSACRIEPGFSCPTQNVACVPSACGNKSVEPGESCDDGNRVASDGCGPTCQKEPTITVGPSPVVQVYCGDGLITGTEQCDDGNVTSGDGCSATCTEEAGFKCTSELKLPGSVDFQVTYRDFKSGSALSGGGHPDFQYAELGHVADIVGPACTTTNGATCGRLDSEGKPALKITTQRVTTGIENADTYGLWFRSANPRGVVGINGPIQVQPFTRTLTLTQTATGSEAYTFDSNGAFFPILGTEGFGNIGAEVTHCVMDDGRPGVTNTTGNPPCDPCDATCMARNFGFTSELRYFFQYRGGETLTFLGDDDVWVFINGRLAVDIGGLHSREYGRVVLGDDGSGGGRDSDCSVHSVTTLPTQPVVGGCYSAGEQSDTTDARFGLTKKGVYEIALFHAERHTSASNFLLTLQGFLAPRSYCQPKCGDGIVVAGEVCDDGDKNQDGVSGSCNTTCTNFAFCGDGVVQTGELCDNKRNTDLYLTAADPKACAPGCVLPPTCGDGVVQGAEQCDKGTAKNNGSYGPDSCTSTCKLGAYCGDGAVNGTEVCDLGKSNGTTYGPGSCGYDCKPGPYCGDKVRNGTEECDEGPAGGGNCGANCKLPPVCGDGVVSEGEACDYGQFASNEYGSCTNQCQWAIRCGDGIVTTPFEECDYGQASNLGGYDGCSATCTLGPRCGDAVLQSTQGEQCDNGFNDDTYQYSPKACARGCKRPGYCGDGQVALGYELCDEGSKNDDSTYDGCTTKCEWGPYCGDGVMNPDGGEVCDNGSSNVVYAKSASGCGFDCRPAPYCGDGERNGGEQCDLGTSGNTGEYGGCNPDCTSTAHCGDGVVQSGEACDDGPTGSLLCTAQCELRPIIQ